MPVQLSSMKNSIASKISDFQANRLPDARDASFDYCFNYFRSFYETNDLNRLVAPSQLEVSCLQLSFYLASWGMLRGSSFLLQKSTMFYIRIVNLISSFDKRIWKIDIDTYSKETISLLLSFASALADTLRPYRPSDTLTTKIMLGVFGIVPAFDQYFKNGMGITTFNEKTLLALHNFYECNRAEIDSINIKTLEFGSGTETTRVYTKAKLIDMFGFIVSYDKLRQK